MQKGGDGLDLTFKPESANPCSRTAVLKLYSTSELPRRLVQTQMAGSQPQNADSVDLGEL